MIPFAAKLNPIHDKRCRIIKDDFFCFRVGIFLKIRGEIRKIMSPDKENEMNLI